MKAGVSVSGMPVISYLQVFYECEYEMKNKTDFNKTSIFPCYGNFITGGYQS